MKRFSLLLFCLTLTCPLHAQSAEPSANHTANDFSFDEDSSTTLKLTLLAIGEELELLWPEQARPEWDTALLGVFASASVDAATPYIEISSGTLSARQYFRPGDNGKRWLNLSFLRDALTPGAHVRLTSEGMTLQPGDASLRLFDNELDLTQTILVLAPHPDDAEIAAFGLYAQRNATIITVTPGNGGPRSYASVFDDTADDTAEMYHFKGKLRLIDSVTVPWLGSIPPERTFNLGYFNGRLKPMHDAPDTAVPEQFSSNTDIGAYLPYNLGSLLPKQARAATWTHLVDDLVTVLSKVKPDLIVAPHPQLDTHRDHQYTTVALAEALMRWQQKDDVTLLLYTNHADQNRYPYGPAGTLASLPPPQNVHLDRVYSHPVAPELQRLKLFALESMHDLRISPSRLYQLTVGQDRTTEPEAQDAANGMHYLRQGVRANELFYLYSRETFTHMIEAFTGINTKAIRSQTSDR